MILKRKLFRLSLQFFGEQGGDGGATGEGSAETGETASGISEDDIFLAEMEQKYGVANGVAGAQATEFVRAKSGVATHKEAETPATAENGAGTATADPETPAKSAEERFEELIKSDEFKGIYGNKIATAIKDRFGNNDTLKQENDKYKGALGMLAQKYGKNADDFDGIVAAISADDELLESEAIRKGKTVSELRENQKLEAERNKAKKEIEDLKNQLAERDARENARRDVDRWLREAQETVKVYHDFNLETEMQNSDFMRYLRLNKMSVTDAYKHAHLDDLMTASITAAKKSAETEAAKVVESNRQRFREGAATPGSVAPTSRIDLDNMTDADFEKIEQMRRRGVRVTADYFK